MSCLLGDHRHVHHGRRILLPFCLFLPGTVRRRDQKEMKDLLAGLTALLLFGGGGLRVLCSAPQHHPGGVELNQLQLHGDVDGGQALQSPSLDDVGHGRGLEFRWCYVYMGLIEVAT
jgi:hypothetical protein